MGLFDLFKKKQFVESPGTIDELYEVLKKASIEEQSRGAFYDRLILSDLVVLTKVDTAPSGPYTLQPGEELTLVSFDDGKVPIFTSIQRIFDNRRVDAEVQYMILPARSLFETAIGATFILNPFSDYGKELLPAEVEYLLTGGMSNSSRQIAFDKQATVFLGEPAVYPDAIVSALRVLFVTLPDVEAAYVGWMHVPESSDPPHYVFGLKVDKNYDAYKQMVGELFSKSLSLGQIIDIVELRDGDIFSQYFKEQDPFYIRR